MSNQLPTIPKSTRQFEFKNYKISYTAFTMGMYSVLLEAQEEGTSEARLASLKQLVQNCVSESSHEISELPIYLIELIFVKSRILSLGSVVNANYRCNNEVFGEKCGNRIPVDLDLENVEIKKDEDYTNSFDLAGGFKLLFNEPNLLNTAETAKLFDGKITDPADIILMLMDCLYNEETVYKRGSFSAEELRQWVDDNLGLDFLQKVVDQFYSKIPQIGMDLEFKCDKCGHQHNIELRGINQLFQ